MSGAVRCTVCNLVENEHDRALDGHEFLAPPSVESQARALLAGHGLTDDSSADWVTSGPIASAREVIARADALRAAEADLARLREENARLAVKLQAHVVTLGENLVLQEQLAEARGQRDALARAVWAEREAETTYHGALVCNAKGTDRGVDSRESAGAAYNAAIAATNGLLGGAPAGMVDARFYILSLKWSRGDCLTWWRPNAAGYALTLDEAGTFTAAEVDRHCPLTHADDVAAIPAAVALRFSSGVVLDRARQRLLALRWWPSVETPPAANPEGSTP